MRWHCWLASIRCDLRVANWGEDVRDTIENVVKLFRIGRIIGKIGVRSVKQI